MFAYIGRQPIYNSDFVIAAYELLYRNGVSGNAAQFLDPDAATRSVLSDAVKVFGIANLTDGLPAYINFTQNLLMDNFAFLASPNEIVVEVPGDVSVDNALVNKLMELKAAGYKLSLDSYSEVNGLLRFNQITHLFDVIRLNIRKNNRLHLMDLISRLKRSHARLLAEQVETEADFDLARELNFSLFQGYYFERPTYLSKQIELSSSAYGRLLNELLRFNVSADKCRQIILEDVVLTHLFLQQLPGSVRYNPGTVSAYVKNGIANLGIDALRRWITLVILKQANVTNSEELPRSAYVRGLFISRLMERAETDADPAMGFFMGVFSLLDQVMGLQMSDLLTSLNLGPALKAALLGREENEYSKFLSYVVLYEMQNERLILPDIRLKVPESKPADRRDKKDHREEDLKRFVSTMYMQCLSDTDYAFTGLHPNPPVRAYAGNVVGTR